MNLYKPCSKVCEVHTLMKYVRTFNGVRIESLNILKGDSEIGCSGTLIKGPMGVSLILVAQVLIKKLMMQYHADLHTDA